MLLVAQGEPSDADQFFISRWPQARVVSDAEHELYGAFGLERATLAQLLAPRVFGAFWKSRHLGVGVPVGDARLLAGAFLVENGVVMAEHRSDTPADHPDWAALLADVRKRRASM